jgi:uncharacterized membrane protein
VTTAPSQLPDEQPRVSDDVVEPSPSPTHHGVESALSRLLTAGVLGSAAIAALGAVLYLRTHGHDKVDFSAYEPQPPRLASPLAIATDAVHLDASAVIQLGVLILLLTPVARVVFSLVLFALRRDKMYVLITLAVLAVLLAGLLGGVA